MATADNADEPSTRAATEYAAASDALVVASAGEPVRTEEGIPSAAELLGAPRYPAAYPEALGVTAFDADGLPAVGSTQGEQVDVAAPGQNVLTTATGDCLYASGAPSTAFATAYAAGAAALVTGAFPMRALQAGRIA